MRKDQLKKFREMLLKQKQALATAVTDEERGGRDAVTTEARDYGDAATEAYGQEMSFAISDAGRRVLKDIEDALVKIRDGSYGICERCQKPIDPARLEVVPQARMCVACQEAAERDGGR
jgi:DnaK suppressor protein